MAEHAPQLPPESEPRKASLGDVAHWLGQQIVVPTEMPLDCAAHCPRAAEGVTCKDGPLLVAEVTGIYLLPGVEQPALGITPAGFICSREGLAPPEMPQ